MRKQILKLIAILFTLSIIISVCSTEHIVASASPCWAAPRELDEILDDCYSIARGTLVGIRDSEPDRELTSIGDYKYYTFDITECYMGDLDRKENIELCIFNAFTNLRKKGTKSFMKIGNEYLLLIGKNLSVNQGDSYDFQSLLILLDGDDIDGVYYLSDKYPYEFPSTIDELESKISEFYDDPTKNGTTDGTIYTDSSNVRKIVDFSEHIAKVRIIKDDSVYFEDEKREFLLYKAEVLETIKGELQKEISFTAPYDETVIGDEYLALLMSTEGSFYSLSSHYSYIPLSDIERAEEYINAYYHPELVKVIKEQEDTEVTSTNIVKNMVPVYAMLAIAAFAIVIYLISVIYNAVNKQS